MSINLVHLSQTDPVVLKQSKTLNTIKMLLFVLTLNVMVISLFVGFFVYETRSIAVTMQVGVNEQMERFSQFIDKLDGITTSVVELSTKVETIQSKFGVVKDLWSQFKQKESV